MPLRWIEQAEARQVITTALFEGSAEARRPSTAGDAAAQLLPRLGAWLATLHPMGRVSMQVQPALVRQQAGRQQPVPHSDAGYSCDW
jgi:hypothetical protein